jgi:hypothetical protein
MSFTKHIACALVTAVALFSTAAAHAKGPQGAGSGSGTMPTHSAAPGSSGTGSNTWTQPPGWGNAGERKGWDSDATTPPGWGNNTTGQAHGWNGGSTPPGFDKQR